jgi:hypothetical protein
MNLQEIKTQLGILQDAVTKLESQSTGEYVFSKDQLGSFIVKVIDAFADDLRTSISDNLSISDWDITIDIEQQYKSSSFDVTSTLDETEVTSSIDEVITDTASNIEVSEYLLLYHN